jgi:hypothetical protein
MDSDDDGVDDATEGHGDSDGDRIPDYLDAVDDPALLPGSDTTGTSYLLQVSPGLNLALGRTAVVSGLISAAVSEEDLADSGGVGGSAGVNAQDEAYAYPVGIFDFEVSGLSAVGQPVKIVIPTLDEIPDGATYRKYFAPTGWQEFVEDDNNAVASAPGAPGVCPPPGDSSYVSGLTAGHHCIELTIEDGGPNDADGFANGSVRDPGAVAVPVGADDALDDPAGSVSLGGGGGGCALKPQAGVDLTFYVLLAVALVYLSVSRRRLGGR